ncbi:SURF1 family protein [Amaricoccus solimangrovi]|uniref:SURF1-like protein n=1 Tax=Amaricoccus solimangrovi TaxID=2589815 RepID=A0A501WHU9_9RHOB|nr:SURF1 family protein [Amaricoccus solimangrovi]TPE48938.1 SURF1 family protein [Amaricoccus solimangrovi]
MKRVRSILAWLAVALAVTGFVALGVWQLERRAWKHALIARVDARVAAAPAAPPGPGDWAGVSAGRDGYAHVRLTGHFLHDREVTVQAVTELGAGYWVLTPLDAGDFTVLVNRGFVPMDRRDPARRAAGQVAGEVTVTGLLRITEPGGAFLRANNPAAGRWYSRDVAAIAATEGLEGPVAPYFIDADAAPNPGGLPVGGLTVIRFRDSHLSYALTWFALAGGLAGAVIWLRLRGPRDRA